jgi:alpha-beta hydrolase superfamily lysophospholipase
VAPQLLDVSLPGFAKLAPDARASLLVVHGLAEYAGRYLDFAEALSKRGVSCFAYDQIGHGGRPGVRTHVARFDEYVADLGIAARAVRAHSPGAPLFVWGHSMGAIVAALAALERPDACAGVIATSNSLEIFRRGANPLHPVFRALSTIAPRIRIPLGLDARKISSDASVQQAYATDPGIPATASLRLIVEFAKACERVRLLAPRGTKTPWLLAHGELDEIAPALGSQALYDLLGAADKRLVIYPGLRHEVHNEHPAARAAFLDLLTEWVLVRAGAAPESHVRASRSTLA